MKFTKLKAINRSWLQRWLRETFDVTAINREEFISDIRRAEKNNIIATEALTMLEGVLQVDNLQARDIMIPRSNIQFLHHDDDYHTILEKVMQGGHSRYPVFDENRDDVEGILHSKDLLKYVGKENSFDIDDILRPPIIVPESQALNTLLTNFRNSRNHLAIVVDEYSGTSGIVTIEDVLELIVGNIDDEHDRVDDALNIRSHKDGGYTVKAITTIEEFNQHFQTTISNHQFDTIGGIVAHHIGEIPSQGTVVNFNNLEFTVLHSDARRIQLLEVRQAVNKS